MEKKELEEVVERARVSLANGNWDESKHPRGEGGRFGKSGTSVSKFVSKSETKKVPVEVKKGSTMDEHYAAHYSKATDAEVRSAAETYGKYDDEDSVSRMKAIKDEIERRFGIGNTVVNTEGKKPESSEEYELDKGASDASKYDLKPGAIVGLEIMDGGKRNYRITEVTKDGWFRVEQADKPGTNTETVHPTAVTPKKPKESAEGGSNKTAAEEEDPKLVWAKKVYPVVVKSRVAIISQLEGNARRHKIEEFESRHGKGSFEKLARQYGFIKGGK